MGLFNSMPDIESVQSLLALLLGHFLYSEGCPLPPKRCQELLATTQMAIGCRVNHFVVNANLGAIQLRIGMAVPGKYALDCILIYI